MAVTTLPFRQYAGRLVLASGLLLLPGCATFTNISCGLHKSYTQNLELATQYEPLDPQLNNSASTTKRPLRRVPTEASDYSMSFNRGYIKPCSTLTIKKTLNLQRNTDPDITFIETREIYAEDGTLITTQTDDVSEQLAKSGRYVAYTPLPIPRSAPAGKYRVVSTLKVERAHYRRPLLLGKVEGVFYIIPLR